jgi:hypothetical protein
MNGQEAATTQDQANSQKPFPMDDASVFEAWGIDFDPDSGRIRMTGSDPATTEPPTRTGIVESQDAPADDQQPNQQASQQNNGASPADGRIAKLEGVVQQLIGVVTQMASVPSGSNSLNQGEQTQYDLNDQSQLSRFIGDSIQSALKPVMDILPKIVQRIEFQDTRSRYGKDFDDALPFINELTELAAGGALTSGKLYELFQKIKGAGQSANTHGASQGQVQKQTGTAEALISKANRLQTQSGINGSVTSTQRQIASVRDAFEAALEAQS